MSRILLSLFLSISVCAVYATHCDGEFSGSELTVTGCNTINVSGNCTGACYDFFDLELMAGDAIVLTVTTNGGSGFNPNISVWSNSPTFDFQEVCFPDNSSSTTISDTFTAPIDGVYRVEISDFIGGVTDGSYDLVVEGFCDDPTMTTMASPIPTLGEWGLILLSLLLIIFSVFTIKQRVLNNQTT